MNTKHLVAASILALLGTSAALAQDTDAPKTRAEVRAELDAARAAGELDNYGDRYERVERAPFVSTQSREQVRAEVLAARAAGQLDTYGDRDDRIEQTPFVAQKSRADVRAEVVRALKAGEILSAGDYDRG